MAINDWWSRDSAERFWMEIFTNPGPGHELLAPRGNSAHWSYTMTSFVRPGDVVLHYSTLRPNKGAIVGWSLATADPEQIPTYKWQARGTAGRGRGVPTVGPGWRVPLSGFRPLPTVIQNERLQQLLGPLMNVESELAARVGTPTYFPWYRYGGSQLRAQQGYLVKFPSAVIELLPELAAIRDVQAGADLLEDIDDEQRRAGRRAPQGSVTRAQDPILRAAMERRSLDVACQYYESMGATDIVELGKPYDLKLVLAGTERHVEVKGSSLLVDTVELTRNEVTHAGECGAADLVVVDGIDWERQNDGSVTTSGGRLRVWRDWTPREESLTPRKYAYLLPDE